MLQYDVKAISRSSSGMKFVYPSVRLANQKPGTFVSVRYTNQIALFPFVCCFCFVRAFSFQGHTKIALNNRDKPKTNKGLKSVTLRCPMLVKCHLRKSQNLEREEKITDQSNFVHAVT